MASGQVTAPKRTNTWQRRPANGHRKRKLETDWFRVGNNLFSPLTPGTGHFAVGYPNDLLTGLQPAS
jgi:hypothetical protein